MGRVLLDIAGWLLRKLGLLLVLVIALLLAPSVRELWVVARDFDPGTIARDLASHVSRATPAKGDSQEAVDRKLQSLRGALDRKTAERDAVKGETCWMPKCQLVRGAKTYRLELEIHFLTQAVAYGSALANGARSCTQFKRISRQSEDTRGIERELERGKPPLVPRTREHEALKEKIAELEGRLGDLARGCAVYQGLSTTFEPDAATAQQALSDPYRATLADLEELRNSPESLWRSIRNVLPEALLVLVAIIAAPIGVKLATYYWIAPLAARKFHLRLLPDAAGNVSLAAPPAAMQRIELDSGSELLADASLLRSSPNTAQKNTRLLLDWSMPISSLVSRLYLLTCIRTAETGHVSLGAGDDPLGEVAMIDLPEAAAMVLQPRCLVGVVQRLDRPLRVSRHWRAGHLGSWLTLQLRYIVFHGPAKLIVRGRRGIALDPVREATSVNQAATLGFSANVGYGVRRCETFFGYYSGKQELFNDTFSSSDGHYLHEVHPRPAGSAFLPGRGAEGLLNSLLKAFGL